MPYLDCPECGEKTLDPDGFLNLRTKQYEEICHRCIRKEIDAGKRPDETDEARTDARELVLGEDTVKRDKKKKVRAGYLLHRDNIEGVETSLHGMQAFKQAEADQEKAEKDRKAAEKDTEKAFKLEQDHKVETVEEKETKVAEKESHRATQTGHVAHSDHPARRHDKKD